MKNTQERIFIYNRDELKKLTNKTLHSLMQEAELGNYEYPGFVIANIWPNNLIHGNKKYCKWDCCFRPVTEGDEYCKEHYRESIYTEIGYTSSNMYNHENLTLYMD